MTFFRRMIVPITFGGMASGLPPNIVEQLMEAEKMPIRNMEVKKAKSESRLKLVNELDEKLSSIGDSIGTLASVHGFNDYKVLSGDPNIIQGSVDPLTSRPGNWNIEVKQLARKAAAITNGFPDKDRTEIGTGYFKFETPDGEREVYIKGENSTLQGAVHAINNANIGVRASVINDRKYPENPYKIMISGDNVGDDNSVKYPTLYFLDGDQDLYFDQEREAQNGLIKVDGFEFEISDNSVEDLIPGVVLELKQAAPDRQVNVTVTEDREVVAGKVKEFVDAINGVLGFIQTQNRLSKDVDTSKTLGGDGMIRGIETRMRRLIQGAQMGVQGPIKRLSQIGIQFNRGGTLDYKEETFNAVLAKDPDAVQKFLAGDGFSVGFIPSMKNTLSIVQDKVFGPVGSRRKSLQGKIRRIDDQITRKEDQLEKKEQTLRRKFANLETQMSKLKSQGGQVAAIASIGMQTG